jgi:hypothetical protein
MNGGTCHSITYATLARSPGSVPPGEAVRRSQKI